MFWPRQTKISNDVYLQSCQVMFRGLNLCCWRSAFFIQNVTPAWWSIVSPETLPIWHITKINQSTYFGIYFHLTNMIEIFPPNGKKLFYYLYKRRIGLLGVTEEVVHWTKAWWSRISSKVTVTRKLTPCLNRKIWC